MNISSDEHIGLIFGDRDQGVGKTRSIDCVPAPEEEYEERSEHDEISEHVKKSLGEHQTWGSMGISLCISVSFFMGSSSI